MTKVDGQVSTEIDREDADAAERLARAPGAPPSKPRKPPFLVQFWGSAIAKKWLMAVSGIVLLGFVLFHMIGNLKVFIDRAAINNYAEWLRDLGEPAVPRTVVLWIIRTVLITAFAVHILAAYQLTRMNQKARPHADRYQGSRDYAAASYASRTMRWTGVIVGLFVIFHLLDLTWGTVNSHYIRGDVYHNMIESFQRVPVAIVYIVAMLALCFHIWHGAWSIFQSLGVNNPKFNRWRRYFAWTFAAIVTVGNISMPLLIVTRAYP
jgi:succinate dehydrogenase / fumarate reductase, cytochrome b subunit